MFKKDFIRDDGKIRNCDSNIAKMNILEFIVFRKGFVKDYLLGISDCWEYLYNGLQGLLWFVCYTLFMILFPIGFPILAYLRIRQAKQEVKRCSVLRKVINS